jgi:hypothetical protein
VRELDAQRRAIRKPLRPNNTPVEKAGDTNAEAPSTAASDDTSAEAPVTAASDDTSAEAPVTAASDDTSAETQPATEQKTPEGDNA